MIESYVPAAASFAQDIDFVFDLIFWVVIAFWFVVTEAVFFWLLWRFRRKQGVGAQYVTGEQKSEKRWITIPHAFVLLCDVVIVVFAVQVW